MSRFIYLMSIMVYLSFSWSQEVIRIPDEGWRLWPDTAATWKDDQIFLPDEVDLSLLPVNPPTGGWQVLTPATGIPVTLPATVEQYYWGEFGLKPYHEAYYFEREDDGVMNGNYPGVSWWWKEIDIPSTFHGKNVFLFIRGARLRAEVYLNQQLVGYHIITETSFLCDVSKAVTPGEKNLLAIRITNPGGRLDWVDTQYMNWGNYRFHSSHGFGGLDRGIRISAHQSVYIQDLWVANRPKIKSIWAQVELHNTADQEITGTLSYNIIDPEKKNAICSSYQRSITLPGNGQMKIRQDLSFKDAVLWDPDHPRLYALQLTFTPGDGESWSEQNTVNFGFRWFEADGIGENAVLRLNGKRIRLISAISWGFWGINGLWPTAELAEKEVQAAKAFGMNCIQFHRNIGKTEMLEAQDRLGLLRYMEPGGGQTVLGEEFTLYADSPQGPIDDSGNTGDAVSFAEKYMEEKIIRMIRDHRRHPSLLMYGIQNEIHPDLKNPRIFRVIRRMHEEDPSRIVMLKSGIPPVNQVWMQPYSDSVYYDHGNGFSGWWDRHTVGGSGVWKDAMYVNPADFTHYSANDSEIVVWGEMLGAAVPDNHAEMIRKIEVQGGRSYDLEDHRETLQAYENFLDKWNFRKAFPSAEQLFLDIGDKSYDFWGRVIETSRLAEANDYLVISGWESTAIENHSGLVDNLRGFKGNPDLLKTRLASLRPVIKSKSLVIPTGEKDTLDLFLLNESGMPFKGNLRLSVINPVGESTFLGKFRVPQWEKDRFVYLLAHKVVTPAFSAEGKYQLRLESENQPEIFSEDTVLVINSYPPDFAPVRAGVLTQEPEFITRLNALPQLEAEAYNKSANYDVLIANIRLLHGWRSVVDPATEIKNTDDDILVSHRELGILAESGICIFRSASGKSPGNPAFCRGDSEESRRPDHECGDQRGHGIE